MRRGQHTVSCAINSGALFLGVSSPQHENNRRRSLIDLRDHSIGKTLPTATLMRPGSAVFD